jgi:GT2 family glycosyltransferase/glycosyltransferase involved in cell wall biosynthesis
LKPKVKVAFASGTDDLNVRLIARMRELFPQLPLYVVSEFPPEDGDLHWIPYQVRRSLSDNLARCRAALRGKSVRLAGVLLVPNVPFRRMRLLALLLAPLHFLAVNENLNDFMLRPRCVPTMARHFLWRSRNWVRWHFGRNGTLARRDWAADLLAWAARAAATLPRLSGTRASLPARAAEPGISLVIPSRNGRDLLAAQLPGIFRELPPEAEVIVVDNGSDDGTSAWLASHWPQAKLAISPAPLSFAAAVNRGLARAGYARVCLLNNDMLLDPGFFAALDEAFHQVADLFCATAQIRFPAGVRRQETGKAVMAQDTPRDFPLRCDEPLPGEDLTYVLYGSGGCSLYDIGKLRALGGFDESYAPAYVEDLDIGYRAWQRGWPSVYVAGAVVEHRHRATTLRYYTEEQLNAILETNYLRFLVQAVADRRLFRKLWRQAIQRLWLLRNKDALRAAIRIGISNPVLSRARQGAVLSEDLVLALTNGSASLFVGKASRSVPDKPRVLIASPYLPFPLSHGGAVRMYNLMRRAAAEFDQILVAFTDTAAPPPQEVLDCCVEVVLVRRTGSHALPSTGRPDVVEEFASPSFRAALRQTVRKWHPAIAQLEFTQMAQYAAGCAPARTILVEHDVTIDLYAQLLALEEDWELRRQLDLWRPFETAAWRQVTRVVTMSEKDRAMVADARAVTLPNGVDVERFRPSSREPQPRRLLFIGSFAHLPNLMAAQFFLNEVWPKLQQVTLHLIAGARHEYFLARYADRVKLNLDRPGLEVEGFVGDVRPAYERAAIVVAPLLASAGTNIKILEAMAMAKAIVSTPAGVNGLDLRPGEDFLLAKTAGEMASAIEVLLQDPMARKRLERSARLRAEREYGWDQIARRQADLYRQLL